MSTQSPQEVAEFNLEQRRDARAPKASKEPAPLPCLQCTTLFTPRRAHQKFCHTKCRQAFHTAGDGGLYGKVSRVTLLKSGGVNLTLRFDPIDRENALSLIRGGLVDVREVKGAPGA